MRDDFPESLKPFQALIESTAIPAVLLSLKQVATEPHQSKIGGVPYFDYASPHLWTRNSKGDITPWPKHPQTGRELFLLLQVNFSEMPSLPGFPSEGILQIFVDDRNWLDLEEELVTFYYPQVTQINMTSSYDFKQVSQQFRVKGYALSFTKEFEFMTESDFRFNTLYGKPTAEGHVLTRRLRQSSVFKDYLRITNHRYSGHVEHGYGRNKIGGYHYSQNARDPRAYLRMIDESWGDSRLLLQLQNYTDLCWGDGGSAQLFITEVDLEARRFENVRFHWDST